MHVKERQPGDVDQLKALIHRENNAKQRNQCRIALLAGERQRSAGLQVRQCEAARLGH